jgi:hypothetical protein
MTIQIQIRNTAQKVKGSLYKVRIFFLKIGQYGYQNIRIFTLISKN